MSKGERDPRFPISEQALITLRMKGYPAEGWMLLANAGVNALTWLSTDWVLQARALSKFERFQNQLRLIEHLPDDPHFRGASSDLLCIDQEYFWLVMPRLPGRAYNARQHSWDVIKQKALEILPEMLRQLQKLQQTQLDDAVLQPLLQDMRKMFAISTEEVQQRAQKIFPNWQQWLHLLPAEPVTPLVFSHGDPILKNTLVDEQAYLIDWEDCGPLQQHQDPAHIFSYLAKYCPPQHWSQLNQRFVAAGAAQVSGLDEKDWLAAVQWQILREFTDKPLREDELAKLPQQEQALSEWLAQSWRSSGSAVTV